jgi:hypothetical protein
VIFSIFKKHTSRIIYVYNTRIGAECPHQFMPLDIKKHKQQLLPNFAGIKI